MTLARCHGCDPTCKGPHAFGCEHYTPPEPEGMWADWTLLHWLRLGWFLATRWMR